MAVRLGNIEPVDFRLGDKQVERLCLGNEVIWQRRLIEGVDYERFQWLVSKSTGESSFPYFHHNVKKTDIIKCGVLLAANETFARYRLYNEGQFRIGRALNGSYSNFLWGTAFTGYKTIKEYNDFVLKILENDDFYFSVNGTAYTITNNVVADELINCRFGCQGKCKYLQFNDEILLPAKLTRNIPSNISADNKTHYQGECGMVDEINNKFYGNVNSSGSFTVSND